MNAEQIQKTTDRIVAEAFRARQTKKANVWDDIRGAAENFQTYRQLRDAWDQPGVSQAVTGAGIGAGLGGLLSLLGRRRRGRDILRNLLLGAVAGGGLGYGRHLWQQASDPAADRPADPTVKWKKDPDTGDMIPVRTDPPEPGDPATEPGEPEVPTYEDLHPGIPEYLARLPFSLSPTVDRKPDLNRLRFDDPSVLEAFGGEHGELIPWRVPEAVAGYGAGAAAGVGAVTAAQSPFKMFGEWRRAVEARKAIAEKLRGTPRPTMVDPQAQQRAEGLLRNPLFLDQAARTGDVDRAFRATNPRAADTGARIQLGDYVGPDAAAHIRENISKTRDTKAFGSPRVSLTKTVTPTGVGGRVGGIAGMLAVPAISTSIGYQDQHRQRDVGRMMRHHEERTQKERGDTAP